MSYFYYIFSAVLLVAYGYWVCPDLTQQPTTLIAANFILPFIVAASIKWRFEEELVDAAPAGHQPGRQFYFDIAIYAMAGAYIALVMQNYCHNANLSVAKLFMGTMLIGYFASIDNTLRRERSLTGDNINVKVNDEKLFSIHTKFNTFLLTTLVIALIATGLSTAEVIGWPFTADHPRGEQGMQIFLADIMFIMITVLILTFRLIHAYARNMHQVLKQQLEILEVVKSGNFEQKVPVTSHDEAGLLAQGINQLIKDIGDRDRMRVILGRIVSPNIMEKLLTTDDSTLKSGQEYDVAILFCDLRGFTSLSEKMPAEEVIFFLNAYFSEMTTIVSNNNGIINKFMGDAVLAIFGLDKDSNPIQDAVQASRDILDYAKTIHLTAQNDLGVGVGIHSGTVIAGTIGSEERYEYTFIGDAVNTASRLDGLTKRLGHRIIISVDAYQGLSDTMMGKFTDLGPQMLRGKKEPVHVYGSGYIEGWSE
ncbi:MAG: hypothetical protein BMS9Abin26_1732 [Gammaproteobacteria bacterium]|nr:MAG: hypothetical protein BMS9Abin26_1732 [Gammaproteobacteria bacterium]